MRCPMKEPRAPPSEIYFLIQVSRNEKDLSRARRSGAPFFHDSILLRRFFLRTIRVTGERREEGDAGSRCTCMSAKIMESFRGVSCADTPEGNDGCAGDVH